MRLNTSVVKLLLGRPLLSGLLLRLARTLSQTQFGSTRSRRKQAPRNDLKHSMRSRTMKERLIIFDTTMRDGEQSPGASMTKEEKLRIARQLERMRVDVIEAGFPAS